MRSCISMSFTVLRADEVPTKATRTSKTTPLRLAMEKLAVGEALEVAFDSHDPENGYRPTTISQVAGIMSGRSATIKFAVRKKADGTGCYMIAGPKTDETAPARARKSNASAATNGEAA